MYVIEKIVVTALIIELLLLGFVSYVFYNKLSRIERREAYIEYRINVTPSPLPTQSATTSGTPTPIKSLLKGASTSALPVRK